MSGPRRMLPNGTCAAMGMEPTPNPSPPVPMRGSTKARVSGRGEGTADVHAARIKKKCAIIEETGMGGQLKMKGPRTRGRFEQAGWYCFEW